MTDYLTQAREWLAGHAAANNGDLMRGLDAALAAKFEEVSRAAWADPAREYLHAICDAYEEWVKTSDEAEDDEDGAAEIVAARDVLDDQIARACEARQEP